MTTKLSTACVAKKDGAFFIARRKAGGEMGERWELPGGKAEEGEEPRDALKRELKEELDVDAEIGALLAEHEFFHKGARHILHAYETRFLSDNFTLAEHTEWRWAGWAEIEALYKEEKFTPSDWSVLIKACKLNARICDGFTSGNEDRKRKLYYYTTSIEGDLSAVKARKDAGNADLSNKSALPKGAS